MQIQAAKEGLGIVNIPKLIGENDKDLTNIQNKDENFSVEVWLVLPKLSAKNKRVRTVSNFIEKKIKDILKK